MNGSMRTPLYHWHSTNGAKFVEFAGWEMPLQYSAGIVEEHLATRRAGGLFDVSHMGRLRISGAGRVAFLQHTLSNNVEAMAPWQAQYTLIPDERGGAHDDAYLYRFDEEAYLLVVNAANLSGDLEHLQRERAHFEHVEIEDVTVKVSMLSMQGPLARQVLKETLDEGELPEAFRNRASEALIAGATTQICRTGYSGEPIGFELFTSAAAIEAVWTRILSIGSQRGIVPVGLGARDTLRLEAGLPLYGNEYGTDPAGNRLPAYAFPLAGVGISFSPIKGEYIGRPALALQFEEVRKLHKGIRPDPAILPRRIQPIALSDPGIARRGYPIRKGKREVGVVTSGTMVPYWQFAGQGATMSMTEKRGRRAIALALLDTDLRVGDIVEVVVRDRPRKAHIVNWHGRSEAPPYFHPITLDHEISETKRDREESLLQARRLLTRSIENHRWRQVSCVNLIPSEMTPSPLVRMLQVSDPVARYAEHKELLAAFSEEVYYYQGTDFIAWVENRLAEEMGRFLGCNLVELRPLSGQMANMAVFSAMVDFINRVDRRREPRRMRLVMNNHLNNGGHLSAQTMGALRDYVAKDPITEKFAVVNFPVCHENPFKIDVAETLRLLDAASPELIVFGKSVVLHPEPVAQIRKAYESSDSKPIIMYDMAHVLGLVGRHFQEPFAEGADIVTGSTHKTFFGTQRGVIGGQFEESRPDFGLWRAIRRRSFPGMTSNHHLGTLLGLLMAAIEMNTFKGPYQRQVLANAKAFARALNDCGLHIEGDPAVDYTESHQVIVNVGFSKGCETARHLEENNIIVNFQGLRGDESFTASSGIRTGVSEMTRFGMKERDFETFAELFAAAIKGRDVARQVAHFREAFQTMQYCFTDGSLQPYADELQSTFSF